MEETKKQMFNEFTGFLVFFYLIPILLLSFGYLPFWSRHLILTLMGIILTAYAIDHGIKTNQLGIVKSHPRSTFILNGALVVVVCALSYVLVSTGSLKPIGYDGSLLFFLFYVLISAPIQEFIFRSLMFYELGVFLGGHLWMKIIFSAMIYALAHAMYHSWVVLAGTFILGLFWGYIYAKTKNFWGIALSHAVIGAVTIMLGLV
jgi:membrane protease YdiL (CAAX protease family)